MSDAKKDDMLETLYSLKILLIMFLAMLILDEYFIGIQTIEMANFLAIRADHVDRASPNIDHYFNDSVLKYFIFTKINPFFSIREIRTTPANNQIITILSVHPSRWLSDFSDKTFPKAISTHATRVKNEK